MIRAAFDGTFAGWRAAARGMLAAGVAPGMIDWTGEGDAQPTLGFDAGASAAAVPAATQPGDAGRVPKEFLALAAAGACHRDGERWALLYRVLWRLTHGERALLEVATDPDVHRLLRMEKAVRRSSHKMKAFVRFRRVEHEGGEHYVAWFEPEHDVLVRTAPFFVDRFASMRWSILTPDGCAHWDGDALSLTSGVPRSAAPDPDALEAAWRTYYASTFNPARLRTNAMRAEMPVRYWKNLPEAQLIAPLVRDAPTRVREMIEREAGARERAAKRVFRSPAEKREAQGEE